MIWVFWISFGLLVWTYVGYGLMWTGLMLIWPKRGTIPNRPPELAATLLVAAHNEAGTIAAKIENALSLDISPAKLKIVITCDGCTDATADIARSYTDRGVTVLDCEVHHGKVAALNTALSQIKSDVVIFSDANSMIVPGALTALLRHFQDGQVGGVCGAIEIEPVTGGWLERAETIYWTYDHALKRAESAVAGAVSAQGGLYAIRRALIGTVPEALADDAAISLDVVRRGYRLVFEPAATVSEGLSTSLQREFGRRVRSTEQGWRCLMHFSDLLNPFRHGLYALQLISHKLLRRVTSFFFLAVLVSSTTLWTQGPVYPIVSIMLIAIVMLGVLGILFQERLPRSLAAPAYIVLMSAAMTLGVLKAITGQRTVSWSPAR